MLLAWLPAACAWTTLGGQGFGPARLEAVRHRKASVSSPLRAPPARPPARRRCPSTGARTRAGARPRAAATPTRPPTRPATPRAGCRWRSSGWGASCVPRPPRRSGFRWWITYWCRGARRRGPQRRGGSRCGRAPCRCWRGTGPHDSRPVGRQLGVQCQIISSSAHPNCGPFAFCVAVALYFCACTCLCRIFWRPSALRRPTMIPPLHVFLGATYCRLFLPWQVQTRCTGASS